MRVRHVFVSFSFLLRNSDFTCLPLCLSLLTFFVSFNSLERFLLRTWSTEIVLILITCTGDIEIVSLLSLEDNVYTHAMSPLLLCCSFLSPLETKQEKPLFLRQYVLHCILDNVHSTFCTFLEGNIRLCLYRNTRKFLMEEETETSFLSLFLFPFLIIRIMT